jgi:hypothetical protein
VTAAVATKNNHTGDESTVDAKRENRRSTRLAELDSSSRPFFTDPTKADIEDIEEQLHSLSNTLNERRNARPRSYVRVRTYEKLCTRTLRTCSSDEIHGSFGRMKNPYQQGSMLIKDRRANYPSWDRRQRRRVFIFLFPQMKKMSSRAIFPFLSRDLSHHRNSIFVTGYTFVRFSIVSYIVPEKRQGTIKGRHEKEKSLTVSSVEPEANDRGWRIVAHISCADAIVEYYRAIIPSILSH